MVFLGTVIVSTQLFTRYKFVTAFEVDQVLLNIFCPATALNVQNLQSHPLLQ